MFHAAGFELATLALRDDAIDLRDYARKLAGDSTRKVALVAEVERDGLKRSTVAKAGYVVRIEMAYGVSFLSAAGACAAIYWAVAQ